MTDNELIAMVGQYLRNLATHKTPCPSGRNHASALASHIRALRNSAAQMLTTVEQHQMDKGMVGALKMLERQGAIQIDGDVVRLTPERQHHD